MILLRNKTVAHTILPQFHNANGSLSQESLLRSRNFAPMATSQHTSPGKERKRDISFPSSLLLRCRSSLLRPFCNRSRERQETTEDESAGTNQCKDVTFKLLNKKINLVPVNLCVLFQMTQRYRTDDSVTQLLDKIDFVILPVFNVDGYSYTWIDPVMIFFSYISLMLTID